MTDMAAEDCMEYIKQYARQPRDVAPRFRLPCSTMDKLDQDFILFMSFAFDCLEKLKHSKHLEICKLWFTKLCSEHYDTVSSKQTRNLYLSRLLLNIQDGKFSPDFLAPPPSVCGFLPFCENISMCTAAVYSPPREDPEGAPHIMNQDINISNYQHMSQDRRTYLAMQAIPRGLMSYVAVTIGGDAPQWVNKEGEPLPFPPSGNAIKVATPGPTNYKFFVKQGRLHLNQEESLRERKQKILARRKPVNERAKLIRFYEQILSRIDDEIEQLDGKTCSENKDPFIERLTEKLQVDLMTQNTDTIQDINNAVEQRKALLSMLRKNIESQKNNIFQNREEILNKVESSIQRAENFRRDTGFQFIKPHENTAIDEIDYKSTIWGTLLNEKLQPKHETILLKKYCPEIVTVLTSLLKEDKMKIMNKAQGLVQDIEEQMRHDLQDEIQKGLIRFSNARQEWIKIQKVLKDIDRIRQEIVEDKLECQGPAETKTRQNLLETCAQVASMKCKLECLSKRNEDLINQIKIKHGKIHRVKDQNIACQDVLNTEYEQLKICIGEKLNDIREQEFAITKLKEFKTQ